MSALTDEEKTRTRHHLVTCTSCGSAQAGSNFYWRRFVKGLTPRMPCKACSGPLHAAKMREWRKTKSGSASVKATLKAWHAKNPNYERERSKNRYAADPKYRSRVREGSRKHMRENREYYRMKENERRARVEAAGRMVNAEQWRCIVLAYDERCVYCGRFSDTKLTVEHIVPLSRGGSHAPVNLAPACKSCNSQKLDRPLSVFMERVSTERRAAFDAARKKALPRIALEMSLGRAEVSDVCTH